MTPGILYAIKDETMILVHGLLVQKTVVLDAIVCMLTVLESI
jgi:hypothetical protein